MPRTKSKQTPRPAARATAALPKGDVLTSTEAAAYLRVSADDLTKLIADQGLPARRVGDDWRILKGAIQEWLRTGIISPPATNGIWATAGAFKDDPDLEEIVKEAYRRRGRPNTEDE
jgi:excisionase family DNA binding protein